MKTLNRLILCVLVGAGATCIVAWACAIVGRKSVPVNFPIQPCDSRAYELACRVVTRAPRSGTLSAEMGSTVTAVSLSESSLGIGAAPVAEVHCVLAGWPFFSLGAERLESLASTAAHSLRSSWRRGIDVPSSGGATRTLPFAPIWPGFLADTAIFGAVGYAILAAARGGVWQWRRRNSRCVHCGYALSPQQSVCPECGADTC